MGQLKLFEWGSDEKLDRSRIVYCKPGCAFDYAESERYIEKMGGRMLTLQEARDFMGGKALYPGKENWAAIQGRDWVEIGQEHF